MWPTGPDGCPLLGSGLPPAGRCPECAIFAGDSVQFQAGANSDRNSRIHLIWGERHASPKRSSSDAFGPPARAASLWHAEYAAASGWSPARRIFVQSGERDGLLWNSESAASVVARSGRIQLAVPRVHGALLHLTYDADAWRVDSIPARALYATIAEASDGALYMAYVGADRENESTPGTILLSRAATSGGAWSEPRRIGASRSGGATRLRLLIGSRAVLHLLWSVSESGPLTTSAVRYVASENGGRTWSGRTDLPLPHEPFTKWRVAVDRCGSPHVLVSTWTRHGTISLGRVLHSSMSVHGWTPLTPLQLGTSAREIAVDSDAAGTIYLVASVDTSAARGERPAYGVVVSRFGDRDAVTASASR